MVPCYIAVFALTIALFAYIFWSARNLFTQADKTRVDYLRERKDAIYENLRDLNFEHQAGKLPDQDFQSLKTSLEDEAAAILAEMARLEQAATRPLSGRKETRV